MRIGELSRVTGASARSLRYYEELGMIKPNRSGNGYRTYEPDVVDRVRQIRGLLDSGVPAWGVARMLPCLEEGSIVPDQTPQELLVGLDREISSLEGHIARLTRRRDALERYKAAVLGR